MAMHIIFYAPFGYGIPPHRIGGAETGCRRTLGIYRDAGIDVICIDKPMRGRSAAAYAARMAKAYAAFVAQLLRHPDAIVHIAGFYDKIIDIESAFLSTAAALGHKTIYEVRNGGMIRIYNERGPRYRRTQLRIFAKATGILCQGECYVDFIREHLSRHALYYPNYIEDAYFKPWQPHDFSHGLNLVYFGRVTPSKNVDVVIRAAALVQSRLPDTHLHIVGAVTDEYQRILQSTIDQCGMPSGHVIFHGRKNFDEISRLLRQSHFFVFPSAEPNEGHSNSLTEAMGCGVVPVTSTAGFNALICGIPELVIGSAEPRAYADTILKIMSEGTWDAYSRRVHQRIRDNFTKSIVGARLIDYVTSL